MMTETGRVVAVEDSQLWVEVIQQSTCGACSAQKACGQSLLQQLYNGRRSHINVHFDAQQFPNIQVNDQVEINLPEQIVLWGSFLLYILPLLGLLLGAGVGQWLALENLFENLSASSEVASIVGALIGFVGGVLLAKRRAQVTTKNPDCRPNLVAVH